MAKLISLLFFLLVFTGNAFAETPLIKITGNERTDKDYIKALTKTCLKQKETTGLILKKDLETCLMNSKLFSKVTVQISEQYFQIQVEERWTLIPIPMVQGGSGAKTSYGVLVFESNFLGTGKALIAGGVTGEDQSTYLLMYKDPSILFSRWNWGASAQHVQRVKYLYDGKDEINGVNETESFYKLEFGYQFTKEILAGYQYLDMEHSYQQEDDYQKPEDENFRFHGLNVNFKDVDFKFYYQDGLRIQLRGLWQESEADVKIPLSHYKATMLWQKPGYSNQVFQIKLLGEQVLNAKNNYMIRTGGNTGLRGIPSAGAWADSYLAIGLDYQIPVMEQASGYWTVAPFYDRGSINPYGSGEWIHYQAYGLGSYYYLRKIALPGLGIIAGYNHQYQGFFYSFTIGFSQ